MGGGGRLLGSTLTCNDYGIKIGMDSICTGRDTHAINHHNGFRSINKLHYCVLSTCSKCISLHWVVVLHISGCKGRTLKPSFSFRSPESAL